MLQSDVLWVEKYGDCISEVGNRMFADLIRKTEEVYVDDILMKSLK